MSYGNPVKNKFHGQWNYSIKPQLDRKMERLFFDDSLSPTKNHVPCQLSENNLD